MTKVLCHGVFDVLHAGHLAYFKAAKKFGDYLVVSVTTDRYVNKGPGRPYFNHNLRAEMVKALGVVDHVVISDHPTAAETIRLIRPDYYVKGPDYRDLTKDVTGEIYNEQKAVEEHGGKLVFTEEETHSSSTLINRFFQNWSDEQRAEIEKVKSLGGLGAIERAIEKIARINVLVVGEAILDVYRFVNPEGISSKSPTVSARFLHEEIYQGGSIAIQNHLSAFAKSVTLQHQTAPVAKKIRYISGTQRIFEVTEINDKQETTEYFCDRLIENAKEADVIVAADFGHGLFEGPALKLMKDLDPFIGLNVQTNSSNFGFNVYSKHEGFDYLCLDTREARLAVHDRFDAPFDVATRVKRDIGDAFLSMTLGSNGAVFIDTDMQRYHSPAFSDVIIDATGAGDAYFAITTCLLATCCKFELIPFIGNVFAGLKTQIIGNKSAVSKASLLKACAGILK